MPPICVDELDARAKRLPVKDYDREKDGGFIQLNPPSSMEEINAQSNQFLTTSGSRAAIFTFITTAVTGHQGATFGTNRCVHSSLKR
jgi:hypothetical protein